MTPAQIAFLETQLRGPGSLYYVNREAIALHAIEVIEHNLPVATEPSSVGESVAWLKGQSQYVVLRHAALEDFAYMVELPLAWPRE